MNEEQFKLIIQQLSSRISQLELDLAVANSENYLLKQEKENKEEKEED